MSAPSPLRSSPESASARAAGYHTSRVGAAGKLRYRKGPAEPSVVAESEVQLADTRTVCEERIRHDHVSTAAWNASSASAGKPS